MNNYVKPFAEIVEFDVTDIILTSGGRPPLGDDDYDASNSNAAPAFYTPV